MFLSNYRFFKPFKAVCASMFSLTFLLLFIMYLAPVNRAYCFEVSLAWDANTEPDLAGYRIYYRSEGQNYNYSNPAWEGTTTICKVTSKDPDDTTTYYFVARAHDLYGNESENSNQLSYKQEIVKDHDGDGVWDDEDAFPDDPNEWVDTDGDGIGDNGDTDEVAIVEEVIPDTSAAEDTDISDTDTIDYSDEAANDEGAVPEKPAAENSDISDTDDITYYDINANKIEKAEYKKVTHRRSIGISKITKEGYQDNTNRIEDPALLRTERIERWKSFWKKRIEQWKSLMKSNKY